MYIVLQSIIKFSDFRLFTSTPLKIFFESSSIDSDSQESFYIISDFFIQHYFNPCKSSVLVI